VLEKAVKAGKFIEILEIFMEKKYYSEVSMAIHESARDLFEVGEISEAEMKDFYNRCFSQEPKACYKTASPAETKRYNHATT